MLCHLCPRRDLLPAYKANRVKPAPEFRVDLANLQLLLHFTRIPTLSVPGFEADDVSGAGGGDQHTAALASCVKRSCWCQAHSTKGLDGSSVAA